MFFPPIASFPLRGFLDNILFSHPSLLREIMLGSGSSSTRKTSVEFPKSSGPPVLPKKADEAFS